MHPFRFFFLLVLIVSGCNFKSAEYYVIEADKKFEHKAYKESVALLDKAIQKDPKYIGAYINRGAGKAALGMDVSAIEDYRFALTLETANPLALFNIGNTYERLNQHDSAVYYFSRAVESKGGYQRVGQVAIYMDYNQNNFFNMGEYDVPMMNILYGRARAYYSLDSIYLSMMDFVACVENNFEPQDSNYMIGLCLLQYGQNEEACKFFQNSADTGYDFAQQALQKYCAN